MVPRTGTFSRDVRLVPVRGMIAARDPAMDVNIKIEGIDDDDYGSKELEVGYSVTFGGGWSSGPLFNLIGDQWRVIGTQERLRGRLLGSGP